MTFFLLTGKQGVARVNEATKEYQVKQMQQAKKDT